MNPTLRRWLKRGFVVLALLLIFVSFLPLWQTDEWWVRDWDYPRLQVFALLIVCAVMLAVLHRKWSHGEWALGVGIGAATLWQASHFVAYLPPWPKAVASVDNCAPGRSLRLLNFNVLMDNRKFGKGLALIRRADADVVLLLETGPEWAKHIRALYPAYPYRLSEPAPTTYGMMMLSKRPFTGQIRHRLQAGVPSIDASLTLGDGSLIRLHALHPEPPWPGDDAGERDAELVQAGREVRREGRAALVLGDLNDVAWSQTSKLFRQVGGMRDPRIGRGLYPTFNAHYPLLRWPLDHMFVTPHWRIMGIDRLGNAGSDHFAIGYRVCLVDDAAKRLVPVRAPGDVEAEATEQAAEGHEERIKEDRGEE